MHVYVFDNTTGICVYADTTLTGPFPKGYIYYLPLDAGTYDIIIWGWGRDTGNPNLHRSTGTIPAKIEPGVTNITEARFILNELTNASRANNEVNGKIEKTFYGEIPHRVIPPIMADVDTVSLMNISKTIRIIIPDAAEDTVSFRNWKNIQITIEGDNGAYLFTPNANSPVIDHANGLVVDNPFQKLYTDSVLMNDPIYSKFFPGKSATVVDSGLVVDISTLRLLAFNDNMKLVIRWTDALGVPQYREIPFMELLRKAIAQGDYFWDGTPAGYQIVFDRVDAWEIMFYITETWLTASTPIQVSMMDWHVIVSDVEIGNPFGP
jgi:hypothetical protein